MLDRPGTGVATYAGMVRAALPLIAGERLILTDRRGDPDPPAARMRRLLSALSPAADAVALPGRTDGGEARLFSRDLFRVAQVHFDLYRQLLPVHVSGPPGIMHWTYPVPLKIAGWANLYTVHDTIPLDQPDLTPINARRHRRLLHRITAAADRLVTVSEAARADIVAALGCPDELVVNCSQAVDTAWGAAPAALPPGLRRGGYLLVCGTVEPRKNIARLLDAYRASGVALPLVVAGPDGWRADALSDLLAGTSGVVRLPYLARDAMIALIANARALLMPSLAEGFGLPVAEAMALRTPVLAADRGALAETAGGAALLVDPTSSAAIAEAIRRLAQDDGLCAALAAAGSAVAARFTLPCFAARLAALYDAVIAVPR